MLCTICKTSIQIGANFCVMCGTKVMVEKVEKVEKVDVSIVYNNDVPFITKINPVFNGPVTMGHAMFSTNAVVIVKDDVNIVYNNDVPIPTPTKNVPTPTPTKINPVFNGPVTMMGHAMFSTNAVVIDKSSSKYTSTFTGGVKSMVLGNGYTVDGDNIMHFQRGIVGKLPHAYILTIIDGVYLWNGHPLKYYLFESE